MPDRTTTAAKSNYGLAWLLLCIAFALHVWDEAAHDFLSYYNATVLALYGHFSWFPRLDLTFQQWFIGLVATIILLLALTPFAFRNSSWLRAVAYLFGIVLFCAGLGHILMTIRGHSVPSVVFDGPAPGVYSSPLLLLASTYLFWSLYKSSTRSAAAVT